jgi:SnoaL-like domain
MAQQPSSQQGKTQSNLTNKVQQAWTEAFHKRSADAFKRAFAHDVVLEASVLLRPLEGIDQVKTVLGTASEMYDELVFTQAATNGPRTYLEWEARALGGIQLFGVTVLSTNAKGEIARVAIHHRPLNGALKFSAELGHRSRGKIDASYFFDGRPSIG